MRVVRRVKDMGKGQGAYARFRRCFRYKQNVLRIAVERRVHIAGSRGSGERDFGNVGELLCLAADLLRP